jgi:hypothetical protein
MAEKKITKRENFADIEKFLRDNGKNEWADVMAHEIELLAKKSGSSSTKKNEEQDKFLDLIRDVLAECSNALGMQCGAIAKDSRIAEFEWADKKETSPQRVSAMLKKLVDCGDVVKTVDKKVTYFRLA